MREAFWNNTPEGHDDLDLLLDVLVAYGIAITPTTEQIKAFFMLLPADIICSALSWGFSDTEVRDSTYEFVEQNKQAVIDVINALRSN